MTSQLIYKIVPRPLWVEAERSGRFQGASIDLTDGYIHFSTVQQVRETARRHFAGQDDLLLVTVATDRLGDKLKWEPSRGGDLSSASLCDLLMGTVADVVPLPLGPDGHQFDEAIP